MPSTAAAARGGGGKGGGKGGRGGDKWGYAQHPKAAALLIHKIKKLKGAGGGSERGVLDRDHGIYDGAYLYLSYVAWSSKEHSTKYSYHHRTTPVRLQLSMHAMNFQMSKIFCCTYIISYSSGTYLANDHGEIYPIQILNTVRDAFNVLEVRRVRGSDLGIIIANEIGIVGQKAFPSRTDLSSLQMLSRHGSSQLSNQDTMKKQNWYGARYNLPLDIIEWACVPWSNPFPLSLL